MDFLCEGIKMFKNRLIQYSREEKQEAQGNVYNCKIYREKKRNGLIL